MLYFSTYFVATRRRVTQIGHLNEHLAETIRSLLINTRTDTRLPLMIGDEQPLISAKFKYTCTQSKSLKSTAIDVMKPYDADVMKPYDVFNSLMLMFHDVIRFHDVNYTFKTSWESEPQSMTLMGA